MILSHRNVIIHIVAYDNYDDFQHVNFIFSQKSTPLFWVLFNDETNIRVKVLLNLGQGVFFQFSW
jgi:hypothetical protein